MLLPLLYHRSVPSTTASAPPDTNTSSSSTTTTASSSTSISLPTILPSSGSIDTSTTSTPPSPSSPSQKLSPATIAIPVLIGVLVILSLGFCIWRNSRQTGSWRRSDEEIEAMGLGVGVRIGEKGTRKLRVGRDGVVVEVWEKGDGEGMRRGSLASLDSVEDAKEEIWRKEGLRVGGEAKGVGRKESGIVFPAMVLGAGEGRGISVGRKS
ncbi:hypothetical protein E6O75_ATG02537 [Venturia nashicola]|uniref:Uncharacterized protein n=1 Tax=Venturia nashicola TaxID=86259 RepID=A0A4Z1PNF0_9PEZI|nr:hypothetical protein E6O75_ATG02537 [Venturia nashicola]